MRESRTGFAVGPLITVIPDSGNSGSSGWKIASELELSGLWIHVDQVNATGPPTSDGVRVIRYDHRGMDGSDRNVRGEQAIFSSEPIGTALR